MIARGLHGGRWQAIRIHFAYAFVFLVFQMLLSEPWISNKDLLEFHADLLPTQKTPSATSTTIFVLNHKIGFIQPTSDPHLLPEKVTKIKSMDGNHSMTKPTATEVNGYYYSLGRTENNCLLCRSVALEDSFSCGPVLAQSMQPLGIFEVRQRFFVVFFTLRSDSRILMGTVDTQVSSDWRDWRLLPGATIVDHGESAPSSSVASSRFVLDPDETSPYNELCGYLYLHVEEKKNPVVSRLEVNLTKLLDVAGKHRDHAALPFGVLKASSLSVPHADKNLKRKTVLITGVGRSGTGVLCKVFQAVGLRLSHDNHEDCGPYPGSDGAVSWYDAFRYTKREYDTVLHLVRDPLKVILSRATTFGSNKYGLNSFLKQMIGAGKEKLTLADTNSSDSVIAMSTKHWVRRNSFVEAHAEWRERTEDLALDPLVLWRFCMASYFGERCPSLVEWKAAMQKILSTYTNSVEQRLGHETNRLKYTWDEIAAISNSTAAYVRIAKKMAFRYGYMEREEDVSYSCGFGADKRWDCHLQD